MPQLPITWDTAHEKLNIGSKLNRSKFYFTTSVILLLNIACFYGIFTYLAGYRPNADFVGIMVLLIVNGPLGLSLYFAQRIILNTELIRVVNKCFELTSVSLQRK